MNENDLVYKIGYSCNFVRIEINCIKETDNAKHVYIQQPDRLKWPKIVSLIEIFEKAWNHL